MRPQQPVGPLFAHGTYFADALWKLVCVGVVLQLALIEDSNCPIYGNITGDTSSQGQNFRTASPPLLPTPQARLPPLQGAWGPQYGQQLLPHAAFNMHPGAYGAAADESSAGTGEDGSCSNGGGLGLMGPCTATAGAWYAGLRAPVADGRALPVPPAPLSALYGGGMQPTSVIWGLSQHHESSPSGTGQWCPPDGAAATVSSPL